MGIQLNGITGDITTPGDIGIGGTLTYEDVANVDSIGIVTARAGINVSGGTGTFAGNINANGNIVGDNSTNISGINAITATSFSGSGANLTSLPSQVTINNASGNRVITSDGGTTLNGEANLTFDGTNFSVTGGLDLNGGAGNRSNNGVLYISKTNNNDYCLVADVAGNGSSNNGIYINAENATTSAFVIHNVDGPSSTFYINGEGDYFTGHSYPRVDGLKDLGFRSGYRWRDLILSGGVQLGGTGTANYLDDYEEGNYDVSITGSSGGSIGVQGSINNLRYTKIGRMVHVTGRIYLNSSSNPSGTAKMNLPFTASANTNDQNGQCYSYVTRYNVYNPSSHYNLIFEIEPNQSYGFFLWDRPGSPWAGVNAGSELNQTACYLGFDFTYTTAT